MRRRERWRATTALAVVVVFAAAGCTSRPPDLASERELPRSWRSELPGENIAVDLESWWTVFDDPLLHVLVERSASKNLSIRQAAERLRAARELVRPPSVRRLPQLDGNASARYERRLSGRSSGSSIGDGIGGAGDGAPPSPIIESLADGGGRERRSTGSYQAGFDATWELDLFARLAAETRAAEAEVALSAAELEAARVSVAAEVVRVYAELRSAQQQRALLEQSASAQRELLDLVRIRRAAGLARNFDADRAEAAVADTQAQIPQQVENEGIAAQRLAVLMGSPTPDPDWQWPAPQLRARPFGDGLPADLLRSRPEIRQAEASVGRAAAEVGIATGELFPRLSLTGALTVSGNLLGQPLPGRVSLASGGPQLTLPLFDWGARLAVVRARDAALQASLHAYRDAVLSGYEEAENALSGVVMQRARQSSLAVSIAAAQRSEADARRLYENGLVPLDERLQATLVLRQAEIAQATAFEAEAVSVVALFKALGGAPHPGASPSDASAGPTGGIRSGR